MNDAAHVHLLRRGGFILSDQKFFKVKASAAADSQVSRLQGPPAGGQTKTRRPSPAGPLQSTSSRQQLDKRGGGMPAAQAAFTTQVFVLARVDPA